MSHSTELTVECRLDNLARVSAAVREIAGRILESSAADQLEVAVTELCSNIVRHGHRDQPDATFQIMVRGFADRVEVVLRDRGPAFAPHAAPAMPCVDVATEDLPEGGFGMAIVAATMNSFVQNRDGDTNVTTIVKRRR
jgi:anti-sigma regulatory factor (Ser/Thr protein kinase)